MDVKVTLFWVFVLSSSLFAELMTASLVSIWFVFGAFSAVILAMIGAPLWLQIVTFLIVSMIGIMCFRTLWVKKLKTKITPTNLDRLVGKRVIVTVGIDNNIDQGEVKVNGQLWTARSVDEKTINPGEKVEIVRVDGNTLVVKKGD